MLKALRTDKITGWCVTRCGNTPYWLINGKIPDYQRVLSKIIYNFGVAESRYEFISRKDAKNGRLG
ncbi:MAG: hypothetical protein QNJ63_03140 [Calothrix sp. MO_192.B10]|nr:hypothetical protein [Calothrix sp. MO_192.B10]